ncbi:hypothetical protein C0J52_10747 [Blattella germanica]|nr:hypothetical protein C0J52_10747 [Blattella germanica]
MAQAFQEVALATVFTHCAVLFDLSQLSGNSSYRFFTATSLPSTEQVRLNYCPDKFPFDFLYTRSNTTNNPSPKH